MLLWYGAFIAGVIPIIWITYLRKIDLFEKEKITPLIFIFIFGALTPFILIPFHHYVLYPSTFKLNGDIVNDLFYAVAAIGLPEEIVKVIPVFAILFFYPQILNEPFDLIIYACVSALGFSFFENILYVFSSGYEVIPGRSIISTPFHMFCSAIFVYGIILHRYNEQFKNTRWILFVYPLLAIVSHGIFDFFLLNKSLPFLPLFSLLYFMIVVSVFSAMINNSLNQSPFFTSKIVLDSSRTSAVLFKLYAVLLVLYLCGAFFTESEDGTTSIVRTVNGWNAWFVIVMVTRLTRVKLIQKEWMPIKFELPFSFNGSSFAIKGEGFNETYINQFLEEEVKLFPFPKRLNPDGKILNAYIEKKIYDKNLQACYLTKVYSNEDKSQYEYYILSPKKKGVSEYNSKAPIAAFLKLNDNVTGENIARENIENIPFVSWVEILT